jgi:hypothetical protein
MNPSENIDKQIAELPDWRGKMMARLRRLINDAEPSLNEDWKWGTAVWTNSGNVVALAAFQDHVKLNFFKGASLPDPRSLFNAGLDAKESRSIDIGEADNVDEAALKELIRAAAAANDKKTPAKSKK